MATDPAAMTTLPITDDSRRLHVDEEMLEGALRQLRKGAQRIRNVRGRISGRYDTWGQERPGIRPDEAAEQLADGILRDIDRLRAHIVARYWQDRPDLADPREVTDAP